MKNGYIKSIDGLRVIALLGVFMYHLLGMYVPSGYLGVVIFFTLAGFLSMQGIVERENKESVRSGLYKITDKIRKLLPPLILVVLLVSIIMFVFFKRFLNAYPIEAISAVFSFSNYAQIFRNESYFEAMNSLKPLTHIWALSLEMQFYIIFFVLVYTTYKKENKNYFLVIFILLFIISFILSIVLISKNTNLTRVYYGIDTRIGSFTIGMIASILTVNFKEINFSKIVIQISEIILAIVLIAAMFIEYKTDMATIITINIYSVISTILILLLYFDEKVINNDKNVVITIFSSSFIHNVVKRSYIIYLIHYPVIIFMNRFFAHMIIGYGIYILLMMIMTIVITEIIYQFNRIVFIEGNVILKRILSIIFIILIAIICIYAKIANYEKAYSVDSNSVNETIRSEELLETVDSQKNISENIKEIENIDKNQSLDKNKFVPKDPSKVDINDRLVQMAAERIALVNQNIGEAARVDFKNFLSYREMKITLIGDSVSECAKGALSVYFPFSYINAEGNRQLSKAVKIFNEMKAKNEIGDVVVVALGTNSDKDIDVDALETIYYALDGKPMVILTVVTPIMVEETRRNKVIKDFAENHPNCYLADWYAAMKTHAEYFQGDNTHPVGLGNDVFAQIIFKACIDAIDGKKANIKVDKKFKILTKAKIKDEIKLGKYYINDETTKEDIEWIVLDKDDTTHTMLLMSKYAIECKKFNKSYESMSWSRSTLRKWLNEDFYNEVFDDDEKTYVKEKSIDNRKNPIYETNDGGATKDKAFVLSYDEVSKYLDDDLLICKGTKHFINNNGFIDKEKGYEGNCDWWLRTPGDMNNNFMNVSSKGEIIFTGDYSTTDDFGVRPCINVRYE